MNFSTATFPVARVTPNAWHAFGGIWRLTVRRYFTLRHWLMLLGMLVVLVLFAIATRHGGGGGTGRYVGWIGGFYVCFLVPILAFISAGGVIRDDLQADSVDYLFTRPLRRPLFVVFRYVAHTACAQLDFLLALGVLMGFGVVRDAPGLWPALPLLLLAQVLVIVAFSAFGFLCGMVTSRYVIIGLVYGAVIEVGVGHVPTQLNRLSMIQQIISLLEPVMEGSAAAAASAALAVTSLLGFAVLMLVATAALFTLREFAGSGRET